MLVQSSTEALRAIRRMEIRIRRLVDSTFAGAYHTAFRGQGLEFDEVRPYQFGDDVRTIDWNVTARAGQPHIKLFREEREQTLFVLFDISGSQDFGPEEENKREVGTLLTGIFAFSALRNNDKIGLATFTHDIERYFKPHKGRKHILAMVSDLLTHKNAGHTTDLAAALDFVKRILHKRSILIVISDFIPGDDSQLDACETSLRQLSQRHEVILIRLFHPNEVFHTASGTVPVLSIESGRMTWVNAGDSGYRQQLNKTFDALYQRLANFCQKHDIGYLSIDTRSDYIQSLERFFRERKGRK